ncbi:MAG: DUF1957 domain-containing protein [Planctomycetes bacterium]|nr:DUF1957 domain-containing protein [Planctomycetota bacterium]
MPKGYIAIVLHAHLPYVRHPEHDNFLEEMWYYEALAETYLPLLRILGRLEDDGVGYNLLLSLSPTLVSMMEDDLLGSRFVRHVEKIIRLADREAERAAADPVRERIARFYSDFYRDSLFWFDEMCGRRPARAFAKLAGYGNLDIMTCGATHGFLPILQQNPGAVRAQVQEACRYHQSVFGAAPEGIWLPECAYYPGVETVLAEEGLSYSFVDTHGIEHSDTIAERGVYAPLCTSDGVAFFGRDRETGYQVWSAEQGYPGHPDYREFYRDLGFELPEEDLAEFIIDGHIRVNTGLKFSRITSRASGEKQPYDPDAARERAAAHAQHFLDNRVAQVERLCQVVRDRPPLIVSPYDAELFGHWWFEGPRFLDYVLRKMHYDQDVVKSITPALYLEKFPENQCAAPAGSSWGGDGTYEFWVNETNQHLIPQLYQAADRLTAVVDDLQRPDGFGGTPEDECVKQMMRELMLAQASDWPFIMRTGTSPDYAAKRVRDHLDRFWLLENMLTKRRIDGKTLAAIRQADAIFPDCDPRWYGSR